MKINFNKHKFFYISCLIILAFCAYGIYQKLKPNGESYFDNVTLKAVQEHFDGTGKVFAQHNNPSPTCQPSKGCFPGSYVR